MNIGQGGLWAASLLLPLAIAAAWLAPDRWRSQLTGGLVALMGLAGVVMGVAVIAGQSVSATVPLSLPLPAMTIAPDALGGYFIVVIGLVGAVTAWYGMGYARHSPAGSPLMWTAFAGLVASLLLVPACGDAVSFLFCWEMMALTSSVLVFAEHRSRSEVRSAGLWFVVMAHVSFLLLLLGFALLVANADSTSFVDIARAPRSTTAAGWAFALLALGFAAKAGTVPLHVWLPRAHPAAPSHVSALMSAALVKLGVYGVLLVTLRLLPDGPSWQGIVLMLLGGISALFGVLQASVATDLKRLLAYSTTENVGLMFLMVGAASLLTSRGVTDVAGVAAVAALLLVAGHAAFKTAAFLTAGSVLHATGERNLDRMGGLGRAMPVTAGSFGIAAMAAAALPVTGGFVAEWAALQALIHGSVPGDKLVVVVMPAAVAVLALTTGIALMTFVKAYGLAFLARPRAELQSPPHEAGLAMRLGMMAAAGAVIVTGLVPGVVAGAAGRAVGTSVVGGVSAGGLELLPFDVLLDPVSLTVLTAALLVVVTVISVISARRAPRRAVDIVWACGAAELTPRMQYTATSYAEPLTRVFDDVLQQTRDVDVTHTDESRYLVAKVSFSQQLADVFDTRLYRPIIKAVERLGYLGSWLQNGSVHRYLLYSFLGLIAVLVVASL